MPTICFDASLWEDLRFRALPAGLRAALPAVVARLQASGDGVLTDRELRVDLLGPKQFGQLAEALLDWGWLARTGEERLARAGLLAPVSADALRMRRRRQQAGECAPRPDDAVCELQRQLAGLAVAIKSLERRMEVRNDAAAARTSSVDAATAQTRGEGAAMARTSSVGAAMARTDSEQTPNIRRTRSEQEANTVRTVSQPEANLSPAARAVLYACASESESDLIQTEQNLRGESDQSQIPWKNGTLDSRTEAGSLQGAGQASNAGGAPRPVDFFTACVHAIEADRAATPVDNAPRTAFFNTLRAEGYPPAILAEAARRVGERSLWKERYVRKVADNLIEEAARTTPPPEALPPPPAIPAGSVSVRRRGGTVRSESTLDDFTRKNERLWGEYLARRDAAGGAL